MKIIVLIDNIADGELVGEWGLSVYIEYGGKKILLDTGTTGVFAENARKLGIDLAEIDFGVLSHAHYDHADGLGVFFDKNTKARVYLRRGCCENCYSYKEDKMQYIGIHRGWLEAYQDRLTYVDGDFALLTGVKLIPHRTPNLKEVGRKANLFIRKDGTFLPDDFSHEQSLVFETAKGLVIFNSCSHAGADTVIREVMAAYPQKPVYALIGGFHLFRSSEEDVRTLAKRIRQTGISRVITGHCTGEKAFRILREELGDTVLQMHSGLTLEIEEESGLGKLSPRTGD